MEVAQLFEQTVPLPFLQDTIRLLFGSYRTADNECRPPMPWQVAHDYRGHRRRTLIEEQWPVIAQRYAADGVRVSYQPNHAKSSYFTEIVCGSVVLTQSYVETPETVVRRAEFRKTLARSNQRTFFGDDPPPLPDAALYAILIHGEDNRKRHPYFTDVVFPDPRCECYLARINLFSLCRAVVDELIEPMAEEIIPDEARPNLRAEENREA